MAKGRGRSALRATSSIVAAWAMLTLTLMLFVDLEFIGPLNDLSTSFGRLVTTSTITSSASPAAIFFNIYIPKNEFREHALKITASQMKDISFSSLARSHLFLTIIGDSSIDIPGCNDLPNCHVTRKTESGSESLTLSALYEYCLSHENSIVIYIHNKGSFTNTPENEALREMHMRAQFRTNECRKSVEAGICNVCSARFSPLPHFHASGNMWTAHCKYVKGLLSPPKFERRMEDVMVALKADGVLFKEMFPCIGQDGVWDCAVGPHIGLERYSYEHWIHSHPMVVPCDVLPSSFKFVWNYNDIPDSKTLWTPELFVGPRFPLLLYLNNYLPQTPKWWTLKGRIFEWKHLFNCFPPTESWVWKYYGLYSWENAID